MAEAVGLVASVIAIGQVAGAVGKAAIKLKGLWEQVRDVPEQIADLLEELEMLDPLLREIDKQLGQNSLPPELWDDSSTKLSKEYCRRAIDALLGMANDLSRDIAESKGRLRKKIASAKAVLKKDALAQHEKKLKKAMGLLKLSMECYSLAMTRVSHEMVRSSLTQVSTELEVIVQVPQPDPGRRVASVGRVDIDEDEAEDKDEDENKSHKRLPVTTVRGRLKTTYGKPFRRKAFKPNFFGFLYESSPDGKSYRVRLQPPMWLTKRIWEFESRRAYSGWQQINLRIYNKREKDSEIFALADFGQLDRMLEMFDNEEASPFDCDPEGRSLLHYAVFQNHSEMCQTLIELGLDSCIDEPGFLETPRMSTVRWDFSYAGILRGPSSDIAYLEARIAIMDLFWKFDFDDDAAGVGQVDTEVRTWEADFLSQQRCQDVTSYHSLPLKHRLLAVRNNVYREQWRDYRPDSLRYLINADCRLLRRDITESVREGVSLIHSCALALGNKRAVAGSLSEGWNKLTREIILASTVDDLHTVEECTIYQDSWTGTPLISLLHGLAIRGSTKNKWRATYSSAVRNWVGQMKKCGIDLVQYGRQEKAYLSGHLIQVDFNFDGKYREPWELLDLKFGAEPEDWVIIWSLNTWQIAGEFLEMVETPQETPQTWTPRPSKAILTASRAESVRYSMPGEWVS